MILDEVHFTFGEFDSRKYDIVFAHLNSNDLVGDNDIIYGEVDPKHIYNRRTRSNSYIGDNYEDGVAKFKLEIISSCGVPFTQEQRREIEHGLFYPKKFQTLYIDTNDDPFGDTYEIVDGEIKRNGLECRFINPKRIKGDHDLTIGYTVTLETNSIMMWQEPITYTAAPKNGVITLNVYVDSDIDGYIYPIINVKGSAGNWTLINKTDDESRKTTIDYQGDFTIDSTISYVTKEAYSNFSTKYFPRLINGDNEIKITGGCKSVELTFQNRRYF